MIVVVNTDWHSWLVWRHKTQNILKTDGWNLALFSYFGLGGSFFNHQVVLVSRLGYITYDRSSYISELYHWALAWNTDTQRHCSMSVKKYVDPTLLKSVKSNVTAVDWLLFGKCKSLDGSCHLSIYHALTITCKNGHNSKRDEHDRTGFNTQPFRPPSCFTHTHTHTHTPPPVHRVVGRAVVSM